MDLFAQKKNSFQAQLKLEGLEEPSKTRKLNFLAMELQDIKNNKGSVTLQVRSIEHLLTWLGRHQKLQSSLLIKPLDITFDLVKNAQGDNWWKLDNKEDDGDDENKANM
jgi:hypothetical protein